jgi:hypothetical protein
MLPLGYPNGNTSGLVFGASNLGLSVINKRMTCKPQGTGVHQESEGVQECVPRLLCVLQVLGPSMGVLQGRDLDLGECKLLDTHFCQDGCQM